MKIDVKIPYSPTGQLADAYNEALTEGCSEWVLFLDHDVFLCNPHWYDICVKAIESVKDDPKAFCIGCIAGGEIKIRRKKRHPQPLPIDSIAVHIELAKQAYAMHGNEVVPRDKYVTGFFLLVNRKIAKKIGFVQQRLGNIYNIDIDFGTRGLEAGYNIYTIPGLYVYHRRDMSYLKPAFIPKQDET